MNRKFILIGLLLGACFAFTVLQTTTGEAQECDSNPACVENCCEQCDSNPACVENCCPAEEPPHEPPMCGDVPCPPPANVTLDPNIDPRSPAPSGSNGNTSTSNRQGNEDRANRRPHSRPSTPLFVPPRGTQPDVRMELQTEMSCENIRSEIVTRVLDIQKIIEGITKYGIDE